MENLATLKSLLNKGDYMINLDLTDVYQTVPIHRVFQKFLRFLSGHETYQFTAMPFGLDIAPKVVTKIMKLVVASLRSQGVTPLDNFSRRYFDHSLFSRNIEPS
jgi:hypothetical protein